MNIPIIRPVSRVVTVLAASVITLSLGFAFAADPVSDPSSGSAQDLQIEITKKGLGKEVLLRKGVKEWFMLVEVTPEIPS